MIFSENRRPLFAIMRQLILDSGAAGGWNWALSQGETTMLLRLSAVAAVLTAFATFAPAPASAGAIMSLNNRATNDMSHEECMRKAAAAIRRAGFKYHDTTSEAVWGLANNSRDMVAIYCPTTRDIAIFVAGSPTGRGAVTEPLVDRLTDEWGNRD